MDDREWISPEALAVLGAQYPSDTIRMLGRWYDAGRPLLSPRAKAILSAVEARIKVCPWYPPTARGACVDCLSSGICCAYLSGPQSDDEHCQQLAAEIAAMPDAKPKCETCGGSKRVKCPSCTGHGYDYPNGPVCLSCNAEGTIPCPDCKEVFDAPHT